MKPYHPLQCIAASMHACTYQIAALHTCEYQVANRPVIRLIHHLQSSRQTFKQ